MKIVAIAPVALAAALAHCPRAAPCAPLETRCASNVAEICDADGDWHELVDCDLVSEQSEEGFVCAYVDESTDDDRVTGHTCVPDIADGGAP